MKSKRFKAIKNKRKFKSRNHIFEEIVVYKGEFGEISFLRRIIGKPSGKVIFEKKILSTEPYELLDFKEHNKEILKG